MRNTLLAPVCDDACRVLDVLTRGLGPGEGRTLREPSGVHMPLRARRLEDCVAGERFAVGHYHEGRTGTVLTVVPDPEIELLRAPSGMWTPLSHRMPLATGVTVTVTAGSVNVVAVAAHPRLVKLVEVWIANVDANLLRPGLLAGEMRSVAARGGTTSAA